MIKIHNLKYVNNVAVNNVDRCTVMHKKGEKDKNSWSTSNYGCPSKDLSGLHTNPT